MNRENTGVEVETVHAQVQALKKTKSAAIQQLDHQVIGRLKVGHDGPYLFAGEHYGDVWFAFSSYNAMDLSELNTKNVSVEKQQGVEGLVLGR